MIFMSKKSLAVTMSLVLLISFFIPLRGFSAEQSIASYNQEVTQRAKEMEDIFQISIELPYREDGYIAIGTGSLATLDTTLDYITADIISQLSVFFYQKTGNRLTFRFVLEDDVTYSSETGVLASFLPQTATIELHIPNDNSQLTMTGCSPLAIAHEVGHAFYAMLQEKQDVQKIQREWLKLNGSYIYSSGYKENPNKQTFVSLYAANSYLEDFAETFAYGFVSNRDGLGLSNYLNLSWGRSSALSKKLSYMDNLLSNNFINSEQALQNFNLCRQVSPVIQYQDVVLTGNSLEFVQFNAPFGILPAVLDSLKITAISTSWIPEVGGWRVTDVKKGVYLVFPGSGYTTLVVPQ